MYLNVCRYLLEVATQKNQATTLTLKVQEVSNGNMSPTTLYLDFFGFSERPFTLVPDPGFLFWSKQHKRAYSILEFGILSSAPITLITGEIGAGKTTLLQALLAEISDDFVLARIERGRVIWGVIHEEFEGGHAEAGVVFDGQVFG